MIMKSKPKIGILGLGVVGTQFKRWFEGKKYKIGVNLFLYDNKQEKGYSDDINKAEVIFITVHTPSLSDGSIDLSFIESAFKGLTGKKIIIIKSTVLPGTTEYFQKKYKQHKILFSPEFLTEENAWGDIYKPKRQIVGFTKNNLANILNLLSEKIGANYDNVRLGLGADCRIGSSHLDVHAGGYKGFGGCCIPKDLNAFIACLDSCHLLECVDILKKDREFNEKLLESQGLTIQDVSICTFSRTKK